MDKKNTKNVHSACVCYDFFGTGVRRFRLKKSETGEFTNVADWVPDNVRNFDGLDSEDWRELAVTLEDCVKSNADIAPIDQLPVKNEKNQLVWENIKKTLYLVIG